MARARKGKTAARRKNVKKGPPRRKPVRSKAMRGLTDAEIRSLYEMQGERWNPKPATVADMRRALLEDWGDEFLTLDGNYYRNRRRKYGSALRPRKR
jgi:hypothetical protein